MTSYNIPGANPLAYTGVRATTPPNLITAARAPASTDVGYLIGTLWVDTVGQASYQLDGFSSGSASWVALGGGSAFSASSLTATSGNITATNGNLVLGTAGNKISIATGTNASIGVSGAMTAGTITISTTAVTASSRIFLTHATVGGTVGVLSVGTVTAGTSFVINSSSNTDTSTVNWLIIN